MRHVQARLHPPVSAAAEEATAEHAEPTRRGFLGGGSVAVAAAALLAAQAKAQSPSVAEKGEHDASAANLGPDDTALTGTNPDVFTPPITDHGGVPSFWHSFSAVHRRIQEGGWARQINVDDFPLSKTIAGVNMKLNAGGVRELHWHEADEWALMLAGNCRLTAIDFAGRPYVQDVAAGDLWFFPTGVPHSLQGLGPDGCEFLLVFNNGKFSEDNTTLISDWAIHTPPEVLAKNWGVAESALAPLKSVPPEGRWIFQAAVPGPLAQDRAAAARGRAPTPTAFEFRTARLQPQKQSRSGSIRFVDSSNFPISTGIAMAQVTLHPGGLRELHWHANADEWQYYIQGRGRMTLFHNKASARTADFNPGDVGYVPKTLGHYIENIGSTDLVFLEMFASARYQDFSLNDWMTHIPPELVMQHLGIAQQTLDSVPKVNSGVLPG
jgi:oxalate decarboxylase